jgi:hypothetical protein
MREASDWKLSQQAQAHLSSDPSPVRVAPQQFGRPARAAPKNHDCQSLEH